jgi:ppGpp synthetase/RelA/SpoT-type nucleotidyltranferase
MAERTVEDRLRHEYFELLPDIRRVLDELEAEVRHCLLPVFRTLEKYDRLVIKSRIKECESAIDALRRHTRTGRRKKAGQEGRIFDESSPALYTLKELKDLAGVRISVFPGRLIGKVKKQVMKRFRWKPDPVRGGDRTRLLAHKYFGYCSASNIVRGEVQIVPMLTAIFWEVEHTAFYKPSPRLVDLVRTEPMQQHVDEVLRALEGFEREFEKLIRASESRAR